MTRLPNWFLAVSITAIAIACSPKVPPAVSGDTPIFFDGLGTHSRKIGTSSGEAQRWFDQGLAFLYAFNHDEAILSFRRASESDPRSAMAWWGIAVANGPHINFPMVPEDRAKAAWEAIAKARSLSVDSSPADRALIDALTSRYAWPHPADRKPLDEAYAAAMREAWRAHPSDADIGALFAEALMDLRPWDLWTNDGKPQPGTDEVLKTLETVLAMAPRHPLANHLYIHAVEASPHPERADGSAERLRDLQPGLGHLVHMPTHIDVRRGRWEQAIASNSLAMEADRVYRTKRPRQGFYNVYAAHNRHMLTFAAMITGQSASARKTVLELVDGMPEDWQRESAVFADGYVGMPFEVLLRFGKWDEILAAPEPAEYHPIARALRLYARGVAYAARGRVVEARAEQVAFRKAAEATPKDAFFGNNSAADLLGVAENVLEGEILFAEGKHDASIARLRDAVTREDALRYDEPPDWIQPVRHALGAALMKAQKPAEAEVVYREDLRRLPENVWALHGLARSLRVQTRDGEAMAVEARLDKAKAKADIRLSSSCLCLPGI